MAAADSAPAVFSRGDHRADGRLRDQLRPFQAEIALLNRADGSARLVADKTAVLAAVYGPMPPRLPRFEDPDKASIEIVVKPLSGVPGTSGATAHEDGRGGERPSRVRLAPSPRAGHRERAMEDYLLGCIEAVVRRTDIPRTQISVIVQVLADDGAVLATAANCVSLALLDAGIPVRGVLASASVGISKDGETCLDLLRAEEAGADATLLLSCASHEPDKLVASRVLGASPGASARTPCVLEGGVGRWRMVEARRERGGIQRIAHSRSSTSLPHSLRRAGRVAEEHLAVAMADAKAAVAAVRAFLEMALTKRVERTLLRTQPELGRADA